MCILDTENKSENKLRNKYEEKSCLNKLANKKAHTKTTLQFLQKYHYLPYIGTSILVDKGTSILISNKGN